MVAERRKITAEFWIEGRGTRWLVSYESPSIKFYYCIGDLWTNQEQGAKLFPTADVAILAIDKYLKPRIQ